MSHSVQGPDIVAVADDLFRVSIPIPVPLKHVNAYVLKGPDGWTLVDSGFHNEAAEAVWLGTMKALGFGPSDVEQIVVTHLHPDHYGCSGWLQKETGAPVRMGELEIKRAGYVWGSDGAVVEACDRLYRRHGLPEEQLSVLRREHARTRDVHCSPHPRLDPLRHGSMLRMGGKDFVVIHTPGHTDGLTVFWNEADGILLANDLILEDISPNINYWPNMDPDPLSSFLDSLRKVKDLPARRVLTGHRRPIEDLPGRVDELIRHHQERLERCLQLVRSLDGYDGRSGVSAWQLSVHLFGLQENPFAIRFALSEGIAHLEHLAGDGRLQRLEDPAGIRYAPLP